MRISVFSSSMTTVASDVLARERRLLGDRAARACGWRAGRARSRSSDRTSHRAASRSTADDSGAACARARHAQSPADDRRRARKSTRRSTPAESRAIGSGRAFAHREPSAPSRRDRRTSCHARIAREPRLPVIDVVQSCRSLPPPGCPRCHVRGATMRTDTARSVPRC